MQSIIEYKVFFIIALWDLSIVILYSGSSSVSQEPKGSSFAANTSNAGAEPMMAKVASAAAAASGIRLSGTTQSATASPQKGNMTSTLPGINSRSQSNSGWL